MPKKERDKSFGTFIIYTFYVPMSLARAKKIHNVFIIYLVFNINLPWMNEGGKVRNEEKKWRLKFKSATCIK